MAERKPMDPALREYLAEAAAAGAFLPMSTDQEQVRSRRALMELALVRRTEIAGLPNQVTSRSVPVTNEMKARLYSPAAGGAPLPLLVYFHGGGWVAGSLNTHDPFCRLLSERAGVLILAVDYRLAPEHRYPAALEDALAATRWAIAHAQTLGADSLRLAVGGDSAGGALAAVAANRLCSEGAVAGLRALLLLYPVTDHPSAGHASYAENATGCGLEANAMRWYWEQYAPGVSPGDANASPLQLQTPPPGLPPTLVTTAEYDVLRDEGAAYAHKLVSAGVAVSHLHAADMHHDFAVSPGTVARFPQCRLALDEIASWLRRTLEN